MATVAKAANTSQSFSFKQSRVQTNLEVQPQPKSPESVRPAPPMRVRCALARRDPEGPSGQCDNVTESWSMESIPQIATTVGHPKCKHAKARQKAAKRQRLSRLSGVHLLIQSLTQPCCNNVLFSPLFDVGETTAGPQPVLGRPQPYPKGVTRGPSPAAFPGASWAGLFGPLPCLPVSWTPGQP